MSKKCDYNSSKTRVCPAFVVIKENPEPFFKLLSTKLGIMTDDVVLEEIEFAIAGKKKEKALNPNPEYLQWLLRNPEKTEISKRLSGCEPLSLSKNARCRLKLLNGSQAEKADLLREGLDGIKSCKSCERYGKRWFILEGATKPDVFIKTNKFYLVIEGKRTEGGPKIDTYWKRNRHQIVRHLEGLKQYSSSSLPKYGIFIVRGRDADKFKIYDSITPFKESLPHDNELAITIKNMYKGVLTWGELYSAYCGNIKYIDYIESDGTEILSNDYDLND